MIYRIFILVLLSMRMFANGTSYQNRDEEILKEISSGIRHVDQDRIYLDASHVILSDDGIFLITDFNERIPISQLSSSKKGLFVKREEFNIFNMWKCQVSGCGKWNSNFVNACQWCHTPKGETGN